MPRSSESWTQRGERYSRAAVLFLASLLLALVVFRLAFEAGRALGWFMFVGGV